MKNINKISHIKSYLVANQLTDELSAIYIHCCTAKSKYINDMDYLFTDEDRDNFIMLASAWSALLRRTWRIFIIEQKYEPYMFWDAFIQVFVFRPGVLFNDWWKDVLKYDKKLKKMISKTSNPKFMERMFTGLDWKWLYNELSKIE